MKFNVLRCGPVLMGLVGTATIETDCKICKSCIFEKSLRRYLCQILIDLSYIQFSSPKQKA